jgi:heme exporter protein C
VWQTLTRWYHQWGSPRYFYQYAGILLPWLWPISIIVLMTGLVWGLAFAPEDYQQGNSYRIIFIHVPAASAALLGYVSMGVAGLVGLVWRMKMADVMIRAIAPFGAVLAAIALITGAIWGKPTWGTYWVWDARLTSMLLMLFLYLGVFALMTAIPDPRQGGRAASVLSIVGVINVVIVKYSVEWWQSLHQGSTIRVVGETSMPGEMLAPLLISILGVYLLFACTVLLRARTEIIRRERKSQWLQDLLQKGEG